MVSFSEKQQRDLLIAVGLGDFLVGGKITAATRTGVMRALRSIIPAAGRSAARTAPRLASTAFSIARRHPLIFASALAYEGYIHRDEIQDVVEDIRQGVPEVLQMVDDLNRRGAPAGRAVAGAQEFFMERLPGRRDYSGGRSFGGVAPPAQTRKKSPSKFNKAVSAGMKAVKKAKTYGGKGKIKPGKKAFGMVTRLASAKKKGRKAPKSGLRRAVWNAMRGL